MGQAWVHDKPYRLRATAIDRIVEVRMSAAGMLWLMLALALVLSMPLHAIAQERENQTKQLVVGTKEAPRFAMKDEQGNWKGVSIDLWRHIAGRMGL